MNFNDLAIKVFQYHTSPIQTFARSCSKECEKGQRFRLQTK